MKRFAILAVAMVFACCFHLACLPAPTGPTPGSTPTATPTYIPTPGTVCGMVQLTPPAIYLDISYGTTMPIITSQSEWNSLVTYPFPAGPGTPIPTPVPSPVDFNSQTLILTTRELPCGGINPSTITDVCVSPNQTTIHVYTDACITCMYCMAVNTCATIQQMVAVPKSSPTVTYIATFTTH